MASTSQHAKNVRRMLVRTQKLVEAGVIEKPQWLDAILKHPPPHISNGRRPPRITFPEDRLIQSYMARHPETQKTPIDLRSSQPAPARAFAVRQLQLMKGGMSQEASRRQVERETTAAAPPQLPKGSASDPPEGSHLAAVQQAEETALQSAMGHLRGTRGSGLDQLRIAGVS